MSHVLENGNFHRVNAPAARTRKPSRWVLPSAPDEAAVAALASELHLPPVICALLLRRGYDTPESAKRYLRPRLEQLHDPALMLGMHTAVERLVRAIRERERILIHGDYDVDGMCSTTVLLRTIRRLGGNAIPFIPRRIEDGYDLSMAGVNAAIEASAKVLVTCDCGTNALAPVMEACRAGIDVIITDHHLPSGPLPSCLSVLNPKRDGCEYPDKDLAAVGIAFKLSLALTRAMGGQEDDVFRMLDLVALATIADVAPLRGENRVLARAGLKVMKESPNQGVRALLRSSGLEGKPLTAGRIGFILAPRLNAVGRLGHALRGVELLMSENEHEANTIARELEELNRHRQEVDRKTLARARELIEALDLGVRSACRARRVPRPARAIRRASCGCRCDGRTRKGPRARATLQRDRHRAAHGRRSRGRAARRPRASHLERHPRARGAAASLRAVRTIQPHTRDRLARRAARRSCARAGRWAPEAPAANRDGGARGNRLGDGIAGERARRVHTDRHCLPPRAR